MSERNGRPGRAYDENRENWKAWAKEADLPHMSGVSVKPSTILSQIALWSDDEGLELSMGQGDDLVRRIMSAITSPAPSSSLSERRGEMKLTKAQLRYLRSAAINPAGRTYIPSQDGTLQKLVELGLVTHVGANAAYLNSDGRAVLEASDDKA